MGALVAQWVECTSHVQRPLSSQQRPRVRVQPACYPPSIPHPVYCQLSKLSNE